jgi:hypothetical protein
MNQNWNNLVYVQTFEYIKNYIFVASNQFCLTESIVFNFCF